MLYGGAHFASRSASPPSRFRSPSASSSAPLSGYFGGWIDLLLMRLVDILMAFPGILLAIAFTAVLGPGLDHVILALCLIGWTGYARLVRGEILSLREREFVQAARALGCRPKRIILRHLLPNLLPPLLIQATFGLAAAIVAEGSLSFLGLGVEPPTPSWGSMLNDGRQFLLVAPHLTTYPGLALMITVLRAQSRRRRPTGTARARATARSVPAFKAVPNVQAVSEEQWTFERLERFERIYRLA